MTYQENNLPEFENNMAGEFRPAQVFIKPDGSMVVKTNPEFVREIKLPMGTRWVTAPTNSPFAEQELLIGILGELERLIFELNNRVKALEIIFENRF